MAQALYRKWRPQNWNEVVGQEHVIQTLHNALIAERIGHAYLFAGPRGTGKTTTARLLAKAVNCLAEGLADRPCGVCAHCQAVTEGRFLDLIEIDAASNTSVDDVRDLREKINFSPNQGRYKVYIIDEVHMLSTAAFNALLKTLEEPPSHAIFILATTEIHKIPATVLSRCQRHEFRRIPVADIVAHLRKQAEQENIPVENDALTLIARQSTGALRDAISLLDQLASTGQTITLELTQNLLGTAASQAVLDVIEALIARQPDTGINTLQLALDSGSDPRQYARQFVDYLRDLLLMRMGNADQIDATTETRAIMARHAQAYTPAELLRLIRLFNAAANESKNAWQPSLPLELAFIEALEPAGEPESDLNNQASAPRSTLTPRKTRPEAEAPAQTSPAAVEAAPSPTPTEGQPLDDLTFKRVTEHWRRILQSIGQQSKQTQALLNSCKPFGMKDGVLFLGFNGEFAKTKMEKGEHVDLARQVIQQVLGSDIPLRCFVVTGRGGSLPPDVESDGMVAAAMRDLGGELVDVQ
ncbi:MAG TPA: DNA polymerase III subunit gamma/tau [Anaerolineales bacterium]|nr:DNA polymerase III subunit gamma/tau [Anaerolineales bacterium]